MRLERRLRKLLFNMALGFVLLIAGAAHGQHPLIAVLPDLTALCFGMNAEQASLALGAPLIYVRGRRGDELYLARPNVKGAALSYRSDGLYLQFRKGRLTGWKGDWGTIRP
jgi:hypothetical protein